VAIPVALNDTDADGTLDLDAIVITSTPGKGTIASQVSGILTYVPAEDEIGEDTFSYTVADNAGLVSAPATVTLTINDIPVAAALPMTTQEGDSGDLDVLTSATNVIGSLLPASVTIQSEPEHGSATVNSSTGVITYTPDTGFSGSDSFTYTISDDLAAQSSPATVSVTVTPQLRANPDSSVVVQGQNGLIDVLDNDNFSGHTITSLSILSQPEKGQATVINNPLTILYTAGSDQTGLDSFTYTFQTGTGAVSNAATVSVTINPSP
jgi:hypothetical protein